MTIAKKIEEKVKSIVKGKIFTYQDLPIEQSEFPAAAKALERLMKKEVIKKVAKGKFYRPEMSIFGELKPTDNEILKRYLFKDGKRVAYITGIRLYNRMGLTTQVPRIVKLSSKKRISVQIGKTIITSGKSYVEITNENYPLLEILDAIKDIKIIPDLNRKNAITTLCSFIEKLDQEEIKKLVKLALYYPPRVRAFLGALLEYLSVTIVTTDILRENLNPFSEYNLGIDQKILSTAKNWALI